MTVYYKAIRPTGTDFYTGKVQWAPARTKARKGRVVRHPHSKAVGVGAATYLSVSTEPADCTGMGWPCRLLVVEPLPGDLPVSPNPCDLPNKRAAVAWRVVAEVDPTQALGPNGEQVVAFLALLPKLTGPQWDAAWGAAWDAAWGAARAAAWDAAWDAAGNAARAAAGNAALAAAGNAAEALVVRDLISVEDFRTLTASMRAAGVDFDRLLGD